MSRFLSGWRGTGECLIGFVWVRGGPPPVPTGISALPGPHLVVAARYERSPVGPYLELAVAAPARSGRYIGMCSTTMVVNSEEACVAGVEHWAFPKELGTLDWADVEGCVTLRWHDRDILIRGRSRRRSFPLRFPYAAIQSGPDGVNWVNGSLRSKAVAARMEVTVPAGDELSYLDGCHRGVHATNAAVELRPPRLVRRRQQTQLRLTHRTGDAGSMPPRGRDRATRHGRLGGWRGSD